MNTQFSSVNSYYAVTPEKISGFFKDYSWLSNFYGCPIAYNGCLYTSTEAAYQAAKSEDKSVHIRFQAYTAAESKVAGRKLKLRDDWDTAKMTVMRQLLDEKFKFPGELAVKLLATGDAVLEETNHWGDTFWGIDAATGQGKNNLGKMLMEVRQFLREITC